MIQHRNKNVRKRLCGKPKLSRPLHIAALHKKVIMVPVRRELNQSFNLLGSN